MHTGYEEAFVEDAISDEEAMSASPRFVAFRNKGAIAFRLLTEDDEANELVTKDEILLLLSDALERGAQVEIAE